jgi:ABC-type Fe3+ transport system permease subunit
VSRLVADRAGATALPLTVRWPVRAEHVAITVAAVALVVLVVLPLASLFLASVTDEGRLSLGHFREALSRRLYVQALRNS